jgi:transposase
MGYPEAAWERAMTVQEVMLKALSGEVHWFRAADILGWSPRTLRRWRERYETHGYIGLIDKRRHSPSVRRIAAPEVERLLRLYRERYRGFNVRHFHEIARREHGVSVSYSFLKYTLQAAGLVKKHRARGRHRRRRTPRACFGELLHIDGSPHAWLALRPDERAVLIAVLDDATKRVLYAQLWAGETTVAIMTALREVITTQGLPMAVYTDRAHWAFHTPQAAGPVDRRPRTQVGRALERLGVEHIPAYSPQARGRSERLNRTFQDRLVNELRVAQITTLPAANAYLCDRFVPDYNATFSCAPADPASAFVALGKVDLDQILCHQEERIVTQDNTVAFEGRTFQIARQPGRRSCAGLKVIIRRHLTGEYSIWAAARRLGRYPALSARARDRRIAVQPVEAAGAVDAKNAPTAPWKTHKTRFPPLPQASMSP